MRDSVFTFEKYEAQIEKGFINFFYIIKHDQEELKFTEKITFAPVSGFDSTVIKQTLDGLHLALGISYWKLFCPKEILTPKILLSQDQANFWNTVYTKGLGEFFYKNKIDYRDLVNFPFDSESRSQPVSVQRQNRSLVGLGGGKDSIVTGELLKAVGKNFDGFILNLVDIQENIAKIMGIPIVTMKRELDPLIFELNKREDVYNGHVPISSIYAFTGFLAAILFDYKYIVVSNEKSANYGNVEYFGGEINHQWSKSEEFETLVRDYINNYITPDITYFSLLRPYHEINITKIFSKYGKYFGTFTSCNRNFRINNPSSTLWCGECVKCAFVFCLLSAFIDREKLLGIFGKDLYKSEELIPIFEELLGVGDFKPFDCVGTPKEVKLAFLLAYKKGGYDKTFIMKMFYDRFNSEFQTIEQTSSDLLKLGELDNIPPEFRYAVF